MDFFYIFVIISKVGLRNRFKTSCNFFCFSSLCAYPSIIPSYKVYVNENSVKPFETCGMRGPPEAAPLASVVAGVFEAVEFEFPVVDVASMIDYD